MATLAEIMARKVAGAQAPAAPSGGTVIRAADEKDKLAASIKQSLDACAPRLPKPLPPADTRRELGATGELGERLPVDHPPEGAPDAAWEWFNSLHSFDTDLGIVIEPGGTHAWMAVQAMTYDPPLLILRLPIVNRVLPGNPF
ncbi:MAG: hypothetical protein WCQ16_07865 [Verrucomicrobiae bacterium]